MFKGTPHKLDTFIQDYPTLYHTLISLLVSQVLHFTTPKSPDAFHFCK